MKSAKERSVFIIRRILRSKKKECIVWIATRLKNQSGMTSRYIRRMTRAERIIEVKGTKK